MPYTVQMTGTTEIAPEVLVALRGSFQVAADQDIVDQLSIRQLASSADQRVFSFGKILEIDSSVSAALSEYEDPASVPLAGQQTPFTASEFGRVVTTTSLADAISGGALGRQAAAAVGRDAARWNNLFAINTLAAGTNALFAGTAGTNAGVAAGDVMTPQLMNLAYTRLSMAGATKDATGMYRAILHPAQVHDLRAATGAGSWQDINKYSNPDAVLRGEVGTLAGFRIIESSLLAPVDQTGAGTVDLYRAVFFGADALGQGTTVGPDLRLTSSDKLQRFMNYGWYACMTYGIIAQEQVFVVSTSSSLGANAA